MSNYHCHQSVYTPEKIYEAVIAYTINHGYTPKRNDLCLLTGIKDVMTVAKYLHILEDQGLLIYEHNRYRIKDLRAKIDKPDTTILSENENYVYGLILSFVEENDCIPTERELAEISSYSGPGSIHRLIKRLENKGFVKIVGHKMWVKGVSWKRRKKDSI